MITNAAHASPFPNEPSKPAINSPKDAPRAAAKESASKEAGCKAGLPADGDSVGSAYTSRSESLYKKHANRDGDVLELRAEPGEAEAAGSGEAETDPKAKQLAELREWAKEVERELRQQQHKLLERILKQNGRHVDSGDGKFLLFCVPGSEGGPDAENGEDAQVPEYWNAENTSDRIVHFATQMAEISGLDPEAFIGMMRDAVDKGFEQAGEATGPLTGPAAKLNRDTHDLVFSKLSKWLEDRKSLEYNQGARSPAISTAEVPDGIENHQQRKDSPLHHQGENRMG